MKFDSHLGLEDRHGSDKDRRFMEAIFTELQFEVCLVLDVLMGDLTAVLQQRENTCRNIM